MNSARYLIPRADDEPKRTPPESPFRRFVVRCLKCDSHHLRVSAEFREDAGEICLVLHYTKCGEREQVVSA